uniref:Uncharacterized protein n=1 Tax=viral metagenome TaxID=1070528 RepID=A0A2V0RIM0_9ZZZZ
MVGWRYLPQVGDSNEAVEGRDSAGWIGLHHLAGGILSLRGVDIGAEALETAAEATYPLVKGKLPDFLNIVGVYGSVFAAMIQGDYDEYEEEEQQQHETIDIGVSTVSGEPGRGDGHEGQDDQHRRESTGVGNHRSGRRGSRRDYELDGALDGSTE